MDYSLITITGFDANGDAVGNNNKRIIIQNGSKYFAIKQDPTGEPDKVILYEVDID